MMSAIAMKKFIVSIIFCLAICSFSFAQSKFPELDKIKQIKLLESTREDVKRIFSEYEEDFEDDEEEDIEEDQISTEKMSILFHYSLGNCSDDDEQEWNVTKGVVTEIEVMFKDSVKPKNLKIDLSKLERIKKYERDSEDEDPDDFIYYDKNKNISYGLSDGKIENIKFTPSEKNFPALCSNETLREYISNKDWLISKLKNRRSFIVCALPFANLTELTLSKNQITESCSTNGLADVESCQDDAQINIEVKGESSDPTDILRYVYKVSGGKIIGTGTQVIWDLWGVKPGKYTITAIADNGCGVCGKTKTEEVVVKDCPDCKQK